jgi:TRAP-type C4-dicarboxylate transport system substrate-binding protein
MRKLWDEKETASRERVQAAGAQVIEVEKKAFRDAMNPVYDRFITDPALKAMIRSIQSIE